MKHIVLALCYSVALPVSTSAATYYVAPNGKDAHSCSQARSANKPKKTIGAGLGCATPGDTVLVAGGTYVESVSIKKSGRKGRPITLKAKPGSTVTWRSKNTAPNSRNGAISIAKQSFIRIEGFTFKGTVTQTTIYVRNDSARKGSTPVQGIEIINNKFVNNGRNSNQSRIIRFQDTGHKTFGRGDVQNVIAGNTFRGNYGWSVSLGVSSDTVVRRNTCANQKGSKKSGGAYVARCIQIGKNSVRNRVEQNTIRDFTVQSYVGRAPNDIQGIKLDANADKNIIRGNRVYNLDAAGKKSSEGIFVESRCDGNLITENVVYKIGQSCYRDGSRTTTPTVGNQWVNNIGYNCACGLSLSQAKKAVVKNNIFSENRAAQVYVNTDSVANGGHTFSHNLYYKPKTAMLNTWKGKATSCREATHNFSSWTSASKDKKSLAADPKFRNPPSDFRLRSASPAINAGVAGVDMGAYTSGTQAVTQKAATASPSLSVPTGLHVVE